MHLHNNVGRATNNSFLRGKARIDFSQLTSESILEAIYVSGHHEAKSTNWSRGPAVILN